MCLNGPRFTVCKRQLCRSTVGCWGGGGGRTIRSNFGATMEPGEPVTTAGFEAGGSVWYSWRAPATGTFSIRLTADWDAQLAIFTGEEVGALTVLDESDPLDGEGDAVVILAAKKVQATG